MSKVFSITGHSVTGVVTEGRDFLGLHTKEDAEEISRAVLRPVRGNKG